MIHQSQVRKVMQATGMGELQAYRHVQAREHIIRNRLDRPARTLQPQEGRNMEK
jgi:hypothetical protein